MASMKYEIPSSLSDMFAELEGQAYGICAAGLYDGAGAMADEIRQAVPEDSGDLAASLYVAKFQRGMNKVDTEIGFAGYDSKGVPNPVKAAVLESGSSRGHTATHFFSRAVRAAKSKAEAAIQFKIENKIYEISGR